MRVTKDRKTIFIHPPNTGGRYLLDRYQNYWIDDPEEIISLVPDLPGIQEYALRNRCFPIHLTMREVERFFQGDLNNYRKVTLVRNPWERFHSLYRFLLRRTVHRSHPLAVASKTFEGFMKRLCEGEGTFDLAPQIDFLVRDNGYINFDCIGRFEALESDCEEIARRCGFGRGKAVSRSYVRVNYEIDYTPAARGIVEHLSAPIIDIFGYEF